MPLIYLLFQFQPRLLFSLDLHSALTFINEPRLSFSLEPWSRFYMEVTGDAIAQLVLEAFERLPRKRKPRAESDASGRREWVPLAGIVVERA